MFDSIYVFLLLVLFQVGSADTNDQAGATINYGSFDNPSARVRSRFRYWLPDSSVNTVTVQDDIKSAASVGAGGVEFLPFFNYGGALGGPSQDADWSTYGFGSPAFQEMFRAALEAHKDAGLVMDFALGPNQGQGVPAEPDDEGLQWDLTPLSITIPANGSFEGLVPGWGTGQLVALVSAQVLSTLNFSSHGGTIPGQEPTFYSQLVLKHDTLTEWTDHVSSYGNVSLKFPIVENGLEYQLFAFYQHLTLHKNLAFTSNNATNVYENGSYAVDHFSARGAKTVTKFWDEHILTNGVKELLMEVGNYGWEDSIELTSTISWTPSLPGIFYEKYGYDVKRYLPLIMFGNNNIIIQKNAPGSIQCLLDSSEQGAGYVNDFRGALAEGYKGYISHLTSWTRTSLNLQMSAQVSYNLPMDMGALIPFVSAPECESLGFENINAYRHFSGPANLAGKRVISNEMGAVKDKAYQYLLSDLLLSVNKALAGGVNQFVLHGQSFTGNYYETTWPGYTAFLYLFSELYSNKQPSWDNGFSEVLNYIARAQYTQQIGIPKTDVAIYHKDSATDITYPGEDDGPAALIKNGYIFTYLSPDNFVLPQAYVRKGVLAPDGPAYRALVIPSTANMTLESLNKVRSYALGGLSVILSGGTPNYYTSKDSSNKGVFEKAVQLLKTTRNVYSTPSELVADKLASLGLDPQVKVQTNGTWYPTWREDERNGIDYAFIFSDGPASTGHIEVASMKTPYYFNPWTGERKPVLQYQRNRGRTVIPLTLSGNQTVIIAFSSKLNKDVDTPTFYATQVPPNIIGYNYSKKNGMLLHVSAGKSDKPLVLSNGKRYDQLTKLRPSEGFELSNWTLTAEHWEAPQNLSDASIIADKHNTTHTLKSLTSWTSIPGLVNASGVGYYATSMSWPPKNGCADGAYIVFPPVKHTLHVYVNSQRVPPLDYMAPKADIGKYLKKGQNKVVVVVPTTMWNYLRSMFDKLKSGGRPPLYAYLGGTPGLMDNGMVGSVEIVPYITENIGR